MATNHESSISTNFKCVRYNGDVLYHPGFYILKTIIENEWSIKQAANKLPYKTSLENKVDFLNKIISGEINVNAVLAHDIAKAFGGSYLLWDHIQCAYTKACLKIKIEKMFNDNPDKSFRLEEIYNEINYKGDPVVIHNYLVEMSKAQTITKNIAFSEREESYIPIYKLNQNA